MPPTEAEKKTGIKARAFLAAYTETASISKAATAAGIDRATHYRWMGANLKYRQRFEQAQEAAAQILEDEAIRRATEGTLEQIYYQGIPCGRRIVYSDGLMQFLLRGFRPAKYAARSEISGPSGGPLEVSLADVLLARREKENSETS